MQTDEFQKYLERPSLAADWLRSLGLTRSRPAHANLVRMAATDASLESLLKLANQFGTFASQVADADMAWNNLERFLTASLDAAGMVRFLSENEEAALHLLQIFSTSQYLSDLLISDQHSYDMLRMTEGRPVARDTLVEEVVADLLACDSMTSAMTCLRRHKRQETLRIAYGDIIRNQPPGTVARQISFLADAVVEGALAFVLRRLEQTCGTPLTRQGEPTGFCVLALGKLGGMELNYSSDIDLVFLYDAEGQTNTQRSMSNREFFERVARDLVRMLTEMTDLGSAYRVDLRLRPEGRRGAICMSYEQMVAYYDTKGRTWERQAYIKARPIAGSISLGDRFLAQLESWVYARYLSVADITGVKSLKRRIEQEVSTDKMGLRNVKTGHGGIRDVEFVIQFLQLVNGGSLPEARTGNTLEAIVQLEKVGCLTPQERQYLEDNYLMLRKLEHRLQIMYDLQTHILPEDDEELAKLAIRMGYVGDDKTTPLEEFKEDYRQRTQVNRKILDHLMHDVFEDSATPEAEADLVNDPSPTPERIEEVLGRYPFADVHAAYTHLMELANEKIRFLSTRRCRHFLASIAPRLLDAIAKTPEPDSTLVSLARVSDSLGGKAALWELFNANRASLNLYVTLCAACPYLASILTSSPGMIDNLLDSLLVDKLPSHAMLDATLKELIKGAEDPEPILHSFKNSQHLRVGVRDIIGRDDISATHATLSDIAEICLKQVTVNELPALIEKYGEPTIGRPADSLKAQDPEAYERIAQRLGEPCGLVILALGKLGGHEPNYHSDLDLVFLYEADGPTVHRRRSEKPGTTNSHFFNELSQRIIKTTSHIGPYGRLYEIDPRLRPMGKSGVLATPLDRFQRFFRDGQADLWQRQALCKARVIYGAPEASATVMQAIEAIAYAPDWVPSMAEAIRHMRYRLQDNATDRNLKRGAGGTMDTEFVVQMLQLRHGASDPSIRVMGTIDALTALEQGGYLSADHAQGFRESYRFQRSIEARIRLMDFAGRHELPTEQRDLRKLAFLMGYDDSSQVEQRTLETFCHNRERFEAVFSAAIADREPVA